MSKYILFWGHTPSKRNKLGKECLSQWYPSQFTAPIEGLGEDIIFPTAEHYMMVRKAMLFNDVDTAKRILKTESPKDAKRLGRQVKNFEEDLWVKHRKSIVLDGNTYKFTQNDSLRNFMLSIPKGTKFAEASPFDKVWGIGLRESDPRSRDMSKWEGLNILGEVLTEVRENLN